MALLCWLEIWSTIWGLVNQGLALLRRREIETVLVASALIDRVALLLLLRRRAQTWKMPDRWDPWTRMIQCGSDSAQLVLAAATVMATRRLPRTPSLPNA